VEEGCLRITPKKGGDAPRELRVLFSICGKLVGNLSEMRRDYNETT
jgi:hypothetical protein